MIMKKKQVLIDAQKSGIVVKVTYKLGSQPNHAREIIPLKIINDNVIARCLNSNTDKLFRISKLKLLTDDQYTHLEKWDPNFIPLNDYELYEIRRKSIKKALRYFFIILGILAIVVIYFVIRSNAY